MSREDDCLMASHIHVGVCQRAGYANGRADALDEVEAAIQRLVAEIEGASGSHTGAYRIGLATALTAAKGQAAEWADVDLPPLESATKVIDRVGDVWERGASGRWYGSGRSRARWRPTLESLVDTNGPLTVAE